MVRAIYCEMLGYDASFAYIHAIKLAQQGSALEKRVGMFIGKLFLKIHKYAFASKFPRDLREVTWYSSQVISLCPCF